MIKEIYKQLLLARHIPHLADSRFKGDTIYYEVGKKRMVISTTMDVLSVCIYSLEPFQFISRDCFYDVLSVLRFLGVRAKVRVEKWT